jgi:NADH dehydrogenase
MVAGGTGLIGSETVRALVGRGVEVRVMTAHPGSSRGAIESMGATAVRGDVLDEAMLGPAVAGADVVVQALTFPTFPVEKPRRRFTFEQFDGRGTERLVAAAAAAGVRRYVYASGVGADPVSPRTWYRAKWQGEEAVRGSGMEPVVLRPSWVYGPTDIALNKFVRFARLSPFVPVVGSGDQRLQPVLAADVGTALAELSPPGGPTGTFEIGGPDVMTMNQVLGIMLEVLGKRRRLVHFPAFLPKLAGFFLQALPKPPLSPSAIDFATADAVADVGPLLEAVPDLRLRPLPEGLRTYLP